MTIQSIVIAESDLLSRIGLRAVLEKSGYSDAITEVTNFMELVGVMPARGPTVHIVDIHLAGLDGAEGIAELQRRYPETRICVLVDNATRQVALEYLGSGVMGCIAKSRSAEEIAEAVEVISQGRPYLCRLTGEAPSSAPAVQPATKLTRRQRKVLAIMAAGKSNKEIARELGICEGTVKVHVNAAYRALGVHNRVAAVSALRQAQQGRAGDAGPRLPFPELVSFASM